MLTCPPGPLKVDGGVVPFTQAFEHLGSLVTNNLDDSAEVDDSMRSAPAALASLRVQLFGCKVVKSANKNDASAGAYYVNLVLGLLLYGSESWSLTQELRRRLLQTFHS